MVHPVARQQTSFQGQLTHQYPNETLIYNGYLGCSPLYPNVAISLRTLAAYRQAHRTCPRFSIQAQCKMLCYLHNVSATFINQFVVDGSLAAISIIP